MEGELHRFFQEALSFGAFLVSALGEFASFLTSGTPEGTLTRDFLFALMITGFSTLVIDQLRARRERANRRKILTPMRLLLTDALSEANRSVFDYLQAFKSSTRKRLKTRVRNLQDGLSSFRGTLSPAVISSLDYFAPEEQAAIAAYVSEMDARQISEDSKREDVRQWLCRLRDAYGSLQQAIGGEGEKSRLALGAWTEEEMDSLEKEFLFGFFPPATTVQPLMQIA